MGGWKEALNHWQNLFPLWLYTMKRSNSPSPLLYPEAAYMAKELPVFILVSEEEISSYTATLVRRCFPYLTMSDFPFAYFPFKICLL